LPFFQLFLVFAIAAGVGALLIGIPSLIAPRRLTAVKLEPFECR
jgi:NADH:ubiquinone oxidoreductase subunit 3 (subunit A)